MINIEKGFSFESQDKSNESQEELSKKIEAALEEQEKEQKAALEKLNLSDEEKSVFEKAKEKTRKAASIFLVGAMMASSLLAVGCKAENPKTTVQEQTKIEQEKKTTKEEAYTVYVEKAKEVIPEEAIEAWTAVALDSMGSWKETEEGFIVFINALDIYEISEENLGKFKEKLGDYIAQYMHTKLSEDIIYIDKYGRELCPEERTKIMMEKHIKSGVFGQLVKKDGSFAQGLFQKSSQEKWDQAGENVYFYQTAESAEDSESAEVKESPSLDYLDPTLK
ncbi:MAG: hypothetical protein PHF45_02045 [Candidatus Pacebacteria bacterium]|nr:hypothetical protein [Candidatus Paceibacterota bacterium]